MQMGSKPGCYIPLPLRYHCPQCFTKLIKMLHWYHPQCFVELNKNGCANRMESSVSQVVISRLWCFLCAITYPVARFGTPSWFHFVVVLHTNSSNSLIACISTRHKIFSWYWRILLLSLEHFQCLWQPTIPMLKPQIMSQFPC